MTTTTKNTKNTQHIVQEGKFDALWETTHTQLENVHV